MSDLLTPKVAETLMRESNKPCRTHQIDVCNSNHAIRQVWLSAYYSNHAIRQVWLIVFESNHVCLLSTTKHILLKTYLSAKHDELKIIFLMLSIGFKPDGEAEVCLCKDAKDRLL
ncbi:MAG: hypothetical protein CSB01_00120, partial [Bacteroidia bacterium]